MDIKDILDSLGLDLTNPETKRGALEAIEAILDSRNPPPALGGIPTNSGGANGASEAEDIELDPDLLQPSVKHRPPASSDDIEVNDEEHILDRIKHNDSENDIEGNSAGSESTTDDQSSSSNDPKEADDEIRGALDNTDSLEDVPSTANENEQESSSTADNESEAESDKVSQQTSDTEQGDETDKISNDPSEGEATEKPEGDESGAAEETDSMESDSTIEGSKKPADGTDFEDELSDEEALDAEDSFDEDDYLDDTLKSPYEDDAIKAKEEARKIKRERTLQAARTALNSAKAKNAAAPLIRELESAITALEALTEAISKSIKNISDEEFNILVNRVFDAIEALGDSDLTFTSEEDRDLRAQEIKADIASTKTQQELSAEDIAQIRAETQAVQARDKEANRYKRRSSSSFKGFQDFLNSLYRAIALQVSTEEAQDDTWSAINRRHSGSGVLQPGKRINELPNKKIPVIDFYFDCSGSWTDKHIAVGEKAVRQLVEMEEKGQIKINIFYFSDDVFNDATSARLEGGTSGWNEIIKNIISTQATNVIIMTDGDMENWWNGDKALSYTVPGYVWYLWRDGINAPRLPRDLKGRGGTQQFSFNTSDAQ